jgi:hypothetical protein
MRTLLVSCALALIAVTILAATALGFDFSRCLFGDPSTLTIFIQEIDRATGYVLVNGGDSQQPSTPFTWIWGDGVVENGWFPMVHTYADLDRNYVLRAVAHYSGGGTDTAMVVVMFAPPEINPLSLPDEVLVAIPDSTVALDSHWPPYTPPEGLTGFASSFFDLIPRSTIEYVLSLSSYVQMDFVNDNVYRIDGEFPQVIQRDADFGGMYSLWFTDPICFASGDYGFQGEIQWSSFLHEMGHNYTLNTPADYHYGGRVDGNANAIYSEAMAQVFQHATAFELINGAAGYGLGEDLAVDISRSAVQSIALVRDSYDAYVVAGMPFASWNDPGTPEDETFPTFMTLAYEFCAHAETAGPDYVTPARRMLVLLQGFGTDWEALYDPASNTAEADSFRATLLVAAMSYGFGMDLRAEFRALNFPIKDEHYALLMASVAAVEDPGVSPALHLLDPSVPNPFGAATAISYVLHEQGPVELAILDVSGRLVRTFTVRVEEGGRGSVVWDGTNGAGDDVPAGVYFCRLRVSHHNETTRLVRLR